MKNDKEINITAFINMPQLLLRYYVSKTFEMGSQVNF